MDVRLLKKIRRRWRVIKTGHKSWELWDLKFKRPANVFYDWNMNAFKNMWVQSIANTFGSRHWLYTRRQEKRDKITASKNAAKLTVLIKDTK